MIRERVTWYMIVAILMLVGDSFLEGFRIDKLEKRVAALEAKQPAVLVANTGGAR